MPPPRLVAIPSGHEILSRGTPVRPDITVLLNSEVPLGRNSMTRIADNGVCRRECTVSTLPDGRLTVHNIKSSIWLNGMPLALGMTEVLKAGDRIALSDGKYTYEVVYDNDEGVSVNEIFKQQPRARKLMAPSPESSNHAHAEEEADPNSNGGGIAIPQSVLEECYCGVCLDILVKPVSLVSCGHVFCTDCAAPQQQCPSCREPIAKRIPNRFASNIISGLLKHFPSDDVSMYLERTKGCDDPSSSQSHSKSCVDGLKRARKRMRARRSRSSESRQAMPQLPPLSFPPLFQAANLSTTATPARFPLPPLPSSTSIPPNMSLIFAHAHNTAAAAAAAHGHYGHSADDAILID